MLACSKRTAYELIERGELDAIRLSRSDSERHANMRVTKESIERFIKDPTRRVV